MGVQTEITRLQTARNKLRTKAVSLGIGLATDNLTQLATKYDGIKDKGNPQIELSAGESYTIEPGYYQGGTVSGGGGVNLDKPVVIFDGTATANVTADLSKYKLVKIYIATPFQGGFGAYCKLGETCCVGAIGSGAANVRILEVSETGVRTIATHPSNNVSVTLIKKVEAFA